jgi:hypothetical protein
MTIDEVMEDVTESEKEAWASSRRPARKPTAAEIEFYARRDEKIIEVAKSCTEKFSQTIRHIYYVCSGLGIVGKDHGKATYWYEKVNFAICKARWNGTLDWHRIADDSRAFTRPVTWDDHVDFLTQAIPQFAMDKWEGQEKRVIVCVEKDAIMGMLADLCREYHVPIMSFHGQASDGGAILGLAKHIKALTGKCSAVWCLYLGDFDTCGCLIDRVAFGDEKATNSDDQTGKVTRLIWQLTDYADGVPTVIYERIGVVPDDVKDPQYEKYLLEANEDSNFERYRQDVSEVEDFPEIGGLPATLGIDALDHEELVRRTEGHINLMIDQTAWDSQRDKFDGQREALEKLVPMNGGA